VTDSPTRGRAPDGFDLHTRTAAPNYANVLRVRAAHLEVRRGPDAGRSARIDRPTFILGSGEHADLRLTDETISREHVRLSLVHAGLRVRDGGSKNGTRVGTTTVSDATFESDFTLEIGSSVVFVTIEKDPLDLALSPGVQFGDAIGVSPVMRHLFALLEDVARTEITVLMEGETGVGKEVLARSIHARSGRADGPFVIVDCGAIPATLVESELFGHERGAFTGAATSHVGLFEQANGGTLFLDEIGELPLEMQPKLLRVLEERIVRPVGSRESKRVDIRVVAATNRRLEQAVQKNEFRQDLYYRLAVARVTVPPLRDRTEDIAPLAATFLRLAKKDPSARLPVELGELLAGYAWPGNVRELRNVIDRYATLGMMDEIGGLLDARAPAVAEESLADRPYHEARRIVLERLDRAYIPEVIARAKGVIARAAEQAQVARPTFYRMLERLRLADRDDER
jgi:transcriptional regulator with PAS, ATPase and Fis domain